MYFRRKLLLILLKLSDLCIFTAGLLSASWLITANMQGIDLRDFLSIRIKLINLVYLLSMITFWHIIFEKFNLYRSKRLESKVQEWKDILKATTVGTGIFFVGGTIFDIGTLTSDFCITFWLSTTIFTILFRTSLRLFLKHVRLNGRNLRFILIVGTNQRAYDIETWINSHKEEGYRVKGYLDDLTYHLKESVQILGKLSDFSDIIRSTIIDEVFIVLPVKSHYEAIQEIIEKAEEQGIVVRYSSQLFNTKIPHSRSFSKEEFPELSTLNGSQENWQFLLKRVLDILLASLFLIFVFPLLIIVAILIKLTSPGPVLFNQDRVGYNKRIFRLYKFRTMVQDAEEKQSEHEHLNEAAGPVFKIMDDPRVTKVGKFLRKTSIDELPQLFNVIKGDMSLVGPRPLPIRDFNYFNRDWHRRRFSVRPGVTCLWQAYGRHNIKFEQWMKLDMEYIDRWSLLLDIKILIKTIAAVMRGSGAS
jgi:exopolysaccharide biosynthesis polyprenyl glycosylphosphotransferase